MEQLYLSVLTHRRLTMALCALLVVFAAIMLLESGVLIPFIIASMLPVLFSIFDKTIKEVSSSSNIVFEEMTPQKKDLHRNLAYMLKGAIHETT